MNYSSKQCLNYRKHCAGAFALSDSQKFWRKYETESTPAHAAHPTQGSPFNYRLFESCAFSVPTASAAACECASLSKLSRISLRARVHEMLTFARRITTAWPRPVFVSLHASAQICVLISTSVISLLLAHRVQRRRQPLFRGLSPQMSLSPQPRQPWNILVKN